MAKLTGEMKKFKIIILKSIWEKELCQLKQGEQVEVIRAEQVYTVVVDSDNMTRKIPVNINDLIQNEYVKIKSFK